MAKRKSTTETHPKKVSRNKLSISTRRLIIISAAAALVLLVALWITSQGLVTSTAPAGIFSWELTSDPSTVQKMIESWDDQTRLLAAFGLGLDYWFMFAYAVLFSTLASQLGNSLEEKKSGLARLAKPAVTAAWIAAVLDGIENLALLNGLLRRPQSPWQEIAAACATTKFSLLGLVVVYLLAGGIALFTLRRKRGK